METSTFYYTGEQGLQIHTYVWIPDEYTDVKGVLQIAHGMAETAIRYERFAKYLIRYGYIVYANDHRGHGKTAGSIDKLGYLGEGNGFGHLVKDMYTLTKIIKMNHSNIPIFLLGHSMGSFAAQNYMIHYGKEVQGVILSGSNGSRGSSLKVALGVAKSIELIKGPKKKSPLIEKMIFGEYNKQFSPNRTKSDWLSRDVDEVDLYIDDPYCGTIFTTSFYSEFFRMLLYIQDKKNKEKIPKDLPIYIFSGDKDPVGENGEGILKLVKDYEEVGMIDVAYKLYEEGRHEMLNEVNREEVMKHVLLWMNTHGMTKRLR